MLTTSTPRATKFPTAPTSAYRRLFERLLEQGLGKHLLGSVTINFTGNGGFNPKLDIRHFEDLVNRRNGSS